MADSKTKGKAGAPKAGTTQETGSEKKASRGWLKIIAILFLLMILSSVGS